MLRLKLKDGREINLLNTAIIAFVPDGEFTEIRTTNDLFYLVQESCQTIRNRLKKFGFEFE